MADVVPIEVVEIGVQRELGQRVFFAARVHADKAPEANRRNALDRVANVAASVLARRKLAAHDFATAKRQRGIALIDEGDRRLAVALGAATECSRLTRAWRRPSAARLARTSAVGRARNTPSAATAGTRCFCAGVAARALRAGPAWCVRSALARASAATEQRSYQNRRRLQHPMPAHHYNLTPA